MAAKAIHKQKTVTADRRTNCGAKATPGVSSHYLWKNVTCSECKASRNGKSAS